MVIQFLLVCEGSLDTGLAQHIEELLAQYGASQVDGMASYSGRLLSDKVVQGLELAGAVDLLFVHRDADDAGANARFGEIETAVRDSGYAGIWVGLVPVRMTEAWLILDDGAIRRTVRNPRGVTPLNLPTPREAERRADPKTILETVLLDASETRGRRRREIREDLPNLRRQLLRNLPVSGPLEELESWARFRDDTVAALQALGSIP